MDLGYTLAPVKASTPKESANESGPSFNAEDNEKLKALQELKNEKVLFLSDYVISKHKIRIERDRLTQIVGFSIFQIFV